MKRAVLCLLLAFVLGVGFFPLSSFAGTAEVNITRVNHPVAGAAQDTDLELDTQRCTVHSVEWYDKTEGRYLDVNERFKTDHVYQIVVWLESADGYEFSTKDSQTPNVKVRINGELATVTKAYEWQPWAMIDVRYTFTACPARQISRIDATVTLPVPGEHPVFAAQLGSNDYRLLTKAPSISTLYYPMVNGVAWYDMTDHVNVYSSNTFKLGHEYVVSLFLEPNMSSLLFDDQWDMEMYINGVDCSGYYQVSESGYKLQVFWAYLTCTAPAGQIGARVSIPEVGESPYLGGTYFGTSVKDLKNVTWYDVTDGNRRMGAYDLFEGGHVYRVDFQLYLKDGYVANKLPDGTVDKSFVSIEGVEGPLTEVWLYGSGLVQVSHTFEALPDPHVHSPSGWMTDGAEHYQICMICGAGIDGTRAPHSGGTATCLKKAKCAVCNEEYGAFAGHSFGSEWFGESEFTHVHLCTVSGCYASSDASPHRPGPAATETAPQLCLDCNYVLAPAKSHRHSLTRVPALPASCTEGGNLEYYTCSGCSLFFRDGQGASAFSSFRDTLVAAPGHESSGWKADEVSHWKECTRCQTLLEGGKAAHLDGSGDGLCDACQHPVRKAPDPIPDPGSSSGASTDPTTNAVSDLLSDPGSGQPSPTDSSGSGEGEGSLLPVLIAVPVLILGGGVAALLLFLRKKKQ